MFVFWNSWLSAAELRSEKKKPRQEGSCERMFHLVELLASLPQSKHLLLIRRRFTLCRKLQRRKNKVRKVFNSEGECFRTQTCIVNSSRTSTYCHFKSLKMSMFNFHELCFKRSLKTSRRDSCSYSTFIVSIKTNKLRSNGRNNN